MAKKKYIVDIEAPSFVKNGGTASQFLKADGSIDSSEYSIAASAGSDGGVAASVYLFSQLITGGSA